MQSKQEAISNLNHLYGVVDIPYQKSLDYAFRAIENERPQGEWIDCGNYYKCPFCENWVLTSEGKPKFCDECGADMRGDKNEEGKYLRSTAHSSRE